MRRPARGFSIIEVLISFTVLTVAMLALLGLMPVAAKSQASSDYQNRALYEAQEIMDQILGDPARATSTTFTLPPPFFPTPTITVSAATNGRRLVTVRVMWQEESTRLGGGRGSATATVGNTITTMRQLELRSWIE